MKKRTSHCRNFTRKLYKVKVAIGKQRSLSVSEDLIDKADAHYDKCVAYHRRYCAKMRLTVDSWLDCLRHDFQTVCDKIGALIGIVQQV